MTVRSRIVCNATTHTKQNIPNTVADHRTRTFAKMQTPAATSKAPVKYAPGAPPGAPWRHRWQPLGESSVIKVLNAEYYDRNRKKDPSNRFQISHNTGRGKDF